MELILCVLVSFAVLSLCCIGCLPTSGKKVWVEKSGPNDGHCVICGGPLVFLGESGDKTIWRCQSCGMVQHDLSIGGEFDGEA